MAGKNAKVVGIHQTTKVEQQAIETKATANLDSRSLIDDLTVQQ